MIAINNRAWIVQWDELTRWTSPKVSLLPEHLPHGWEKAKVGEVVNQISERVKVDEDTDYNMVGVRWYGEGSFLRETVPGKSLSASYLTPVTPRSFIYNRLFAWKASFAVVPESLQGCFVSSEFPQFQVDESRVLPEYLYLFFMCDKVVKAVNSASTGSAAVSRNRFKEEEFALFEFPLPPLNHQQLIVEPWRQALQSLNDARNALRQVTEHLNEYLVSYVREQNPAALDALKARALIVDWRDMEAIDLKSARAAAFRSGVGDLVAFREFAEEVTELAYPMREPDREWPLYGVNNKEGVVFNQFQKGSDFNAPYKRIREGWFFHNPTRSAVGSLGMVPPVPDDAITSPEYQVWRMKEGLSDVLRDYVAVLITTPLFIDLVRIHRVGAVKQRLYVDNLLSIQVPRVPLQEQRRFAQERSNALLRIKRAQEQAAIVRSEVSEMILGTRPVPHETERIR